MFRIQIQLLLFPKNHSGLKETLTKRNHNHNPLLYTFNILYLNYQIGIGYCNCNVKFEDGCRCRSMTNFLNRSSIKFG